MSKCRNENKDKFKSLPILFRSIYRLKSKIKMDKYKLVRIIAKDLEELKSFTEELSENEDNSSLIIDLALSRARLLCQELELLRSFSPPPDSVKEENENFQEDEEEVSGLSVSDPELEILHFEEQDFPESEELTEELDESVVYNADEDELEETEEEVEEDFDEEDSEDHDDLTEEEEVDDDFQDNEREIEEDEDFALVEDEEDEAELDRDDEEVEPKNDEEEIKEEPQKPVQKTVREIEIEDLDDEEDESVQFSPVSNTGSRPVMREIPKPETPGPEISLPLGDEQKKNIERETAQKERSINETLGENKSAETNLSSGPITSLKAAIGLNDRFLFIREIFNNNSEKYNTIIDHLDKMETIQQAVDYLKVNLSLQKNETSLKFVELLKRRFSK